MPSVLDVLTYAKERVELIKDNLKYYENLEQERGFLLRTEEINYNQYLTSLREMNMLISFIEDLMEINETTV